MRTRFADRADWQRVLAKRFIVRRIDSSRYHGYATLLRFDEIAEPLDVVFAQQQVRIIDRGYTWLQHFPDGAHYVLLAAFDAQGELVQWYIDVVGGMGIDERGIPWYYDLYLDIVIAPTGETLLLDVDELDEALERKEVSQDEYNFAWREANTLLTALEEDMFPLLWLSEMHREELEKELEQGKKPY